MRAGQALAGVATISLPHERGMSHSGLRSGYLAPGRCTASSAQAGLVAQAVELARAASRRLT
jgi:hypothetical protein